MQPAPTIEAKDRVYMPIITALSIAVPLLVAILMYMPRTAEASTSHSFQPLFHAILNGLTAIFLIGGLYLIKAKKIGLHRIFMLIAFALSSAFLLSYVAYHFNYPSAKFGGTGAIRSIYLIILLTHILLATSIVPLALITFYRSFTGQFDKHRKIARITFPIWLYVAVTGVIVYLMMSPYYPA